MDTSPTTGSVTTTTAEKQRLAKSSLAFNCKNATFRKMFPEYVDNYNLQQEQAASEQHASSESRHDKSSRSVSETNLDSAGEDMKK
ncbi:ubiquitin-conjugating enzyme E2 34-like, partial [Trifolium medium]|nr:ubiquitin-conjugating enzyme E2 34-like [Trifolium medium]